MSRYRPVTIAYRVAHCQRSPGAQPLIKQAFLDETNQPGYLRRCNTASDWGRWAIESKLCISVARCVPAHGAVANRMLEDESSQCNPREHPSQVPPGTRASPPIVAAIRVLAPSGSRRDIRALFGNRVHWPCIHHWLKGRRKPPQWAVDCLLARVAPVFLLEAAPAPGTALQAWIARHGRPRGGKRAKEKAASEGG